MCFALEENEKLSAGGEKQLLTGEDGPSMKLDVMKMLMLIL